MLKQLKQSLFAYPQYLLPQHALSRTIKLFTHSRISWWKNFFITWFIHHFQVNMGEAKEPNPKAYQNFNDFFTRALTENARSISDKDNTLVCPADGTISQIGRITDGSIIQAKGRNFSVTDLLGHESPHTETFLDGNFATIYLSPRDYHRLHMPIAGTAVEMRHIPGRLFSVNPATTAVIPNLFARNERVVVFFDTEVGPIALVLVGAIFVASIEILWHGIVTPPSTKNIQSWTYNTNAPTIDRGDEMGRFNMGSTIIVLFGKDCITWNHALQADSKVQLGQEIGEITAC